MSATRGVDVRFGPGLSGMLIRFQQPPPKIAYDSFDEYGADRPLNGFNDSSEWPQNTSSLKAFFVGPYVDRDSYVRVYYWDDFEAYTAVSGSSDLSNFSGGLYNWTSSYVSHDNFVRVLAVDTFDTYAASASLDTLNSGSGWNGAFVSH